MRLCNNGIYSRLHLVLVHAAPALIQINEILDIAFRPLNRGEIQTENPKALCADILHNHLDDLAMHAAVPNNALLADLLPSGFKLRLNQTDQLPLFAQHAKHRRQYLCQRNKGNINRCKIPFIRHLLMRHISYVCFFQTNNSFVIS